MRPTGGGGKMIRRDGFSMAEERYRASFLPYSSEIFVILTCRIVEYKPTLEEIERILREAGLDDEDIKRGASLGPGGVVGGGLPGTSRNRR